jgi:predicted CXXCH cytochrome family protein
MLDEVAGGSLHESFAKGECFTCHDQHASDHDFQLIEAGADNCYPCHEGIQASLDKNRYNHVPLKEGACTGCHNPHGSRIKGRLNRPLGSLCLSCHPDLAADLEEDAFQHAPAREGLCLKCHVPHYANIEGLLTDAGATLCKGCHILNDPAMADAHHSIDIGGADCTGCHETHSAENKGLIHKVTHAPFQEGDCGACH